MNVFNAEVKQRQQYDNSLLFIPRYVIAQRKLIDALQAKSLLERHRYQYERIAIVALSCVQYARNPIDIAQLELIVAVLRTPRGQNNGVFGELFGELRIVVTSPHTSVATTHDKEVANCPAFHRLYDLVGQCDDLVVCKAAHDLARLYLLGRCTALRMFDKGREVFRFTIFTVGDMLKPFVARCARRIYPIYVAFTWRNDTVGGEEDDAVEILKILYLMPPRAPIVAHKVLILLEGWVVVRWQHLAVGIHIHTCPLGLFQELLHVLQVVPANQDAWVLTHP